MPNDPTSLELALRDIKDRNAYHLTDSADCGSPDMRDSEGAAFLIGVRDSVIDSWESNDDLGIVTEIDAWRDVITEIASDAPSVYTHTVWQQFVDLAAYHEDISDYGAVDGDNLESVANSALYIIAERLADALFSELVEAAVEDADEAASEERMAEDDTDEYAVEEEGDEDEDDDLTPSDWQWCDNCQDSHGPLTD